VTEYHTAAPYRSRRRRPVRGLVITLIVLVLLLVTADRVGLLVAERVVSGKVQSSQNLDHRPAVHIEGFPFLTQVIANHYHAVRLDADRLTVGARDKRVTLESLAARLTGVRATNHFSGVTAEQVTATTKIGYSELSRLLGVAIGYQPGGRVQTRKSVTVLGQTVTGTVSARVTVPGGNALAFSDVQIGLDDTAVQLPQAAVDEFTAVFSQQLSLAGLPFRLRVRQLDATSSGVVVTAVASNVALG
jgi:LmeA-like phospholipid-binding